MSNVLEYKCPCCGGQIEFDSESQKMKCPYCETEFDLETLKGYDDVLKNEAPDSMEWEQTPENAWMGEEGEGVCVFICNSCGGEIICDISTAATSCPYCDNPVVMTGRLAGDIKPDLIIPFKLDKKAAKEGLMKHLKGKRLLPKVFKDQNHIDEIKGVYVPFWLFDADANANIRYKGTKVRTWSDRRYIYTETKYFSVSRQGTLGFDYVPADGSSKMADDLMQSIEPYDISQAVDFQTAYLAGYLADRYDVKAEDTFDYVNSRIKNSTESAVASTVTGYSSLVTENSSVQLFNNKTHYALFPVWLLNTTWNGQKYTFAMNGQTGKFVGDLPMDNRACIRWLLGLTAGIGAALFALLTLLS